MSKVSKKMKRNKCKTEKREYKERVNELKKRLDYECGNEEYDDALNTIAELMQADCRDADIMFQTAYVYFKQGDLKRSAIWIDNTLKYNPKHIDVRLLLAKICIEEERIDDALAVYNYVLEKYNNNIDEKQKKEISNQLSKIWDGEQEWIATEYPVVSDFLTNNCHDKMPSNIIQEINDKTVSVQEKVKLFNAFAGAFFVNNELDESEKLLKEAIKLDACNNESIRNMAVICKMKGNKDKALNFAGQMSYTDFCLLKILNE